ncbi:MAG: hypothetical protein K9N07_06605 [Candidatus Cloacimonetes bacterium]|nr:hypothetical protein [Candidatus Cloacimonadota bacterium]
MKKLIFITTLGVFLFLSACTIKYLPIASNNVSITDNYGVVRNKDYTIAAANEYWNRDPQELTNYFTTFYISIQNRGKVNMVVDKSDFGLIDENGNQYDIVTTDYIENMLAPHLIDYLMVSGTNNSIIPNESDYNKQRQMIEKWRLAKNNLITYSFHFGKILPGAKKSGYLFFPKLESKNYNCTFQFDDTNIEFTRADKKKKLKK